MSSKRVEFSAFVEEMIGDKIFDTAMTVIKQALETVINAGKMKPEEFVEAYVTPVTGQLLRLSEIEREFLHQVMKAVNAEASHIPTWNESFETLALLFEDPELPSRFLIGQAIPHVKNLI